MEQSQEEPEYHLTKEIILVTGQKQTGPQGNLRLLRGLQGRSSVTTDKSLVTSGILSFPHLYSESSALDSIHVLSSFNIVGFQKMSRTYTELHFILNRRSWLELEVRGSATTVFSEALFIVSEHLLVCILPSHRSLSLDFPALSTNKSLSFCLKLNCGSVQIQVNHLIMSTPFFYESVSFEVRMRRDGER